MKPKFKDTKLIKESMFPKDQYVVEKGKLKNPRLQKRREIIKHKENNILLICDCSSLEHQIVFRYEVDDNMVFANIHLVKKSFFKRIVLGVKYIFGYSCKYGHFEEFILKREHAWRLIKIANDLKYGIDSPNI
jgi:hypothetical protein